MSSVLDTFSLKGRVAMVTGGFTGLGKQISEAFLEAGADVAVCARRVDKWQDSYASLQSVAASRGRRVYGAHCDVGVKSEIEGFVGEVTAKLGEVDILVNAAGIAWTAPPEEMKLEDWDRVLRTNLTGTFLCSQIAGKRMISRGGGSIINLGSVVGLYGCGPDVLNTIAYTASKAGIIGFTKDLAMKWAEHRVRVNALAPGWFKTHLNERVIETRGQKLIQSIPMRRFGSTTDLKGAALFLASDASSYITGQVICVDGGLTAGR